MSTKYKFNNPDDIYFVSFAVVGWIDVFTRQVYRDLVLESLVFLSEGERFKNPCLDNYEQPCTSYHQ